MCIPSHVQVHVVQFRSLIGVHAEGALTASMHRPLGPAPLLWLSPAIHNRYVLFLVLADLQEHDVIAKTKMYNMKN